MSLRIVIVGGVAGGMSAAARARRLNESASITVLERGGYISFSNCGLPYYLAGRIRDEKDLLVTTPERVRARFAIDARVNHEVTTINRATKVVAGVDRATGKPFEIAYDKLILAPGASPILPPVEHLRAANVFLLRSMEDTQRLHAWLAEHSPRRAVIAGGGYIGLEMAEALRDRSLDVTLVDRNPHVLHLLDAEMSQPIAEELARHQVRVAVGQGLKQLHADGGDDTGGLITAVELRDGERIATDLVVVCVGVKPKVSLATEAGLRIGETGGIAVDDVQRTSDPDVYAVGDAAELTNGVTGRPGRVPLAGPANRQGRTAGEHATTGSARPAGRVMGTSVVQVFGLAAAMTGLGEHAARDAGFDVDTAYVFPKDHASYYPGAQTIRLKLIYDRPTGRVLGAQAVGPAGIDKRIDVIATAMHFNGTHDDLAQLDLAYSPQYGAAKDAVHMVAFVAQNQRAGLTPAVTRTELPPDAMLLDVRSPSEFAAGSLPGAINVPLEQLRDRVGKLDSTRAVVPFCKVGQRGYVAQRILAQHGFIDARNLKGGYTLAESMDSAASGE